MTDLKDSLLVGGVELGCRLFTGTGKYGDDALIPGIVAASGCEVVTVALRRVDLGNPGDNILSHIPAGVRLLPNTSGARSAEEAVRIARLARAAGCGDWIKIEVISDSRHLLPDGYATARATETLAKEGFTVLPYINADLYVARDLVNAGAAAVMPLGAPIGSNRGLKAGEMIRILIEEIDLPVIVDAGLGAPSHACEAMEMGAAACLVNTAIATAGDPVRMARAFADAVRAGRDAFLAGKGRVLEAGAAASSPSPAFLTREVRHAASAFPRLFHDELVRHDRAELARRLSAAPEQAALRAIAAAEQGGRLTEDDYIALLSPAAAPHLERMAGAARAITLRNFGRAVQLFTPLYLANHCTNRCVYCGFNTGNAIPRRRLSMEEVDAEGAAIAATGLRHILLLTGDAPRLTGPEYIAEAARVLRRHMPGISVEVYSLTEEEYALLADSGVDGMTMFQETYNEELYARLHPAGPKRDFRFRLDAPDRAGRAGLRSLNVGALLGLDDWRADSFLTGLHARWLQKQHPAADIALSVPRMRPHVGVFDDVHPVSDRDLVQIIAAARLFLPTAGIVVSSRERADFRDHLMRIAVTRVSAGVSTAVGGHAGAPAQDGDSPQFDIADTRSPAEMSAAIRSLGLAPVFKYWEPLEGESFHCGRASGGSGA